MTKMRTLAKVKLALLIASVVFWIVYGYYFPQLYAYAKTSETNWLYMSRFFVITIIAFGAIDTIIITDYTISRMK